MNNPCGRKSVSLMYEQVNKMMLEEQMLQKRIWAVVGANQKPDVLNMVVALAIGVGFLQDAKELGIENIWLQPGTYDEPVMELIK